MGERTYEMTYKPNAARTLSRVSTGGITFRPSADVLGRSTGRSIEISGKTLYEKLRYRKVGDHATNMPYSLDYNGGRITYVYDKAGNISEIRENGELYVRYKYDALGRLVREDNKRLGKTETHEYDGNGNILAKRVYAFTLLSELEEVTHETVTYAYDGDKLVSYGGEECVYDGIGNPTTYRGKTAIWNKGREMTSYNGVTFSYDGRGRRVGKGNISFTYTSDGKLLGQSDGIEFIYDASGIAGIEYNGSTYLFRRDAQGNVIALIDSAGNVVVQYAYDACGNHAVLGVGGEDITDPAHIGNVNPIRYRGYYYDSEVDLYFLQTRYYDPTTGRFVTIDGIEYADPETLNGLNLYAYCGNNPVMNVDPDGTFLLSFLLAILVGAIVGGVINGVTSAIKGDSFWGGFLSGAIVGGVLGGALILGGATMLAVAGKAVVGFVVASTVSAKLALLAGTAVTTFAVTAGAGMGAYVINESMNGRTISASEMLWQGIMTGIKGIGAYMTGMLLATVGVYNYLLTGNKWSIAEKIKMMLIRSATSFVFQIPWKLGLK